MTGSTEVLTQGLPARRQRNNALFETDHLKAELKARSVRGGVATLFGQGVRFVIQTGSTVVLARLLTPADYGLIGMVTAITGFAGLFKDLGLSMATVQRAEINHEQISTLFWINVALGTVLALLVAIMAPAIAWFYDEPRLTLIAWASAFLFVLGGLTVQHQALLQRQMRFGLLASLDVFSMGMGVAAAITAAVLGAGYWSLIVMSFGSTLASVSGIWMFCHWWPSRPTRGAGVRKMVGFGANLTGFGIFNYMARNLDSILIGKVWGAQLLGLYARAYGLLMFPLSQVNAPVAAVAIPALSRLQNEPERYRDYYLKAISMIAFVTMPLVTFLIVMCQDVVYVLLGPQWGAAAPIFMLLGVAALGQPIANSTGWLYVSQGRTRDMFKWGVMGSSITVAAIVVGLPWGVLGVAASYTIFNVAAAPLLYWFACRKGPVRARHILGAVGPSLLMSLGVLAGLLLFRAAAGISNPACELAIGFVLAVMLVPVITALLPGGRKHLRDFVDLFSFLVSRRLPARVH